MIEKAFTALSADSRRRITEHIANLGNPNPVAAHKSELCLSHFGPKAVDLLIIAASSSDPQVRFRVVWALGKSRDNRALPTLLALTDDPDERVRYDAVLALGELGDVQAIASLEEIARRSSDPAALDSAALCALTKLKSLYETP